MEPLLYVGIVHALFTAIFLGSKTDSSLNDWVLAVWMVFLALPFVSGVAAQSFPGIFIPIISSDLIYPLTYGPFLWLYVGTLTGDISRFKAPHLIHFLPFGIASFGQLITGWAPAPPNPDVIDYNNFTRLVGAINLAVFLAYMIAVFRRLHHHGKDVVMHFSRLSSHVTLTWLRWISAGISGVFFLLFLASSLSSPALLQVYLVAQIGSILTLSFFGLKQKQIFQPAKSSAPQSIRPDHSSQIHSGADHSGASETDIGDGASFVLPKETLPEPSETENATTKMRYDRSGLTEARAENISHRLETYMLDKRPYLEAELTIEKLAKRMAVLRHHLTQVISEQHGKNFYLFVNEYRVHSVTQAMSAPENAGTTLLNLAYDAGFNSKSTFNTAFRRVTGMTPSQYRRQI